MFQTPKDKKTLGARKGVKFNQPIKKKRKLSNETGNKVSNDLKKLDEPHKKFAAFAYTSIKGLKAWNPPLKKDKPKSSEDLEAEERKKNATNFENSLQHKSYGIKSSETKTHLSSLSKPTEDNKLFNHQIPEKKRSQLDIFDVSLNSDKEQAENENEINNSNRENSTLSNYKTNGTSLIGDQIINSENNISGLKKSTDKNNPENNPQKFLNHETTRNIQSFNNKATYDHSSFFKADFNMYEEDLNDFEKDELETLFQNIDRYSGVTPESLNNLDETNRNENFPSHKSPVFNNDSIKKSQEPIIDSNSQKDEKSVNTFTDLENLINKITDSPVCDSDHETIIFNSQADETLLLENNIDKETNTTDTFDGMHCNNFTLVHNSNEVEPKLLINDSQETVIISPKKYKKVPSKDKNFSSFTQKYICNITSENQIDSSCQQNITRANSMSQEKLSEKIVQNLYQEVAVIDGNNSTIDQDLMSPLKKITETVLNVFQHNDTIKISESSDNHLVDEKRRKIITSEAENILAHYQDKNYVDLFLGSEEELNCTASSGHKYSQNYQNIKNDNTIQSARERNKNCEGNNLDLHFMNQKLNIKIDENIVNLTEEDELNQSFSVTESNETDKNGQNLENQIHRLHSIEGKHFENVTQNFEASRFTKKYDNDEAQSTLIDLTKNVPNEIKPEYITTFLENKTNNLEATPKNSSHATIKNIFSISDKADLQSINKSKNETLNGPKEAEVRPFKNFIELYGNDLSSNEMNEESEILSPSVSSINKKMGENTIRQNFIDTLREKSQEIIEIKVSDETNSRSLFGNNNYDSWKQTQTEMDFEVDKANNYISLTKNHNFQEKEVVNFQLSSQATYNEKQNENKAHLINNLHSNEAFKDIRIKNTGIDESSRSLISFGSNKSEENAITTSNQTSLELLHCGKTIPAEKANASTNEEKISNTHSEGKNCSEKNQKKILDSLQYLNQLLNKKTELKKKKIEDITNSVSQISLSLTTFFENYEKRNNNEK